MRVLFIARYRDSTMDRKLAFMSQHPDVTIWQVKPLVWRDELLSTGASEGGSENWRQVPVPLLGRPNEPHRTVYRTSYGWVRAFKPDIIHVEEEPDSLSALQAAMARAVWWPQARLILYTWQNLDRPKRWYVRGVLAATLRAADAILCATTEAVGVLRAVGYGGAATVLPAIGVDTEVFKPAIRTAGGGGIFTVGYVGRLVPEKGIDLLLEAMTSLDPEIRLVVVGDGSSRNGLERQAQQLGLTGRVRFVSAMPPAQVARQLATLDALVLPSRTTRVWKEQFGRVLVEAMACKVPVVGSDSGAIPEVVGDAGLIFPEGDVAALAERLSRLHGSPSLCTDLASRGYDRVQRLYTQERIAERTLAFYRQILAGAGHPC